MIPVHAAGEDDGVAFLAMRFVDGDDLRALRAPRRPARPGRGARQLVEQAAAALDAIHRAGFVHRDVKPGEPAGRPLRPRLSDRLRAGQAGAHQQRRRRAPDSGSARSTTSRRSRSAAGGSTRARTSTRSAACCTSRSPATCRSSATATRRSCGRSSPNRRRSRRRCGRGLPVALDARRRARDGEGPRTSATRRPATSAAPRARPRAAALPASPSGWSRAARPRPARRRPSPGWPRRPRRAPRGAIAGEPPRRRAPLGRCSVAARDRCCGRGRGRRDGAGRGGGRARRAAAAADAPRRPRPRRRAARGGRDDRERRRPPGRDRAAPAATSGSPARAQATLTRIDAATGQRARRASACRRGRRRAIVAYGDDVWVASTSAERGRPPRRPHRRGGARASSVAGQPTRRLAVDAAGSGSRTRLGATARDSVLRYDRDGSLLADASTFSDGVGGARRSAAARSGSSSATRTSSRACGRARGR